MRDIVTAWKTLYKNSIQYQFILSVTIISCVDTQYLCLHLWVISTLMWLITLSLNKQLPLHHLKAKHTLTFKLIFTSGIALLTKLLESSMLMDGHFLTCFLIGWQLGCQRIRNHVRKSHLVNSNFKRESYQQQTQASSVNRFDAVGTKLADIKK